MGLALPAALSLALLAGIIVALHMLRPRRRELSVSSTIPWRALGQAETRASQAWRRPIRSPLLWLQLAILAALVLALARPWLSRDVAVGDHLILMVDRSLTMAATDGSPTRLDEARELAMARVRAASGRPVTLIAFDRGAELLVAESTDPRPVEIALDRLRPVLVPGRLDDALALADALAAGTPGAQLVIVTDGKADSAPWASYTMPIEQLRVGRSDDNQTIAALDLGDGDAGSEVFLRVTNSAGKAAERRIETYLDGELYDARDLSLPTGGQRSFSIVTNGRPERVEARLVGDDALPQDDRAWALRPRSRSLSVLWISRGNHFVETALSSMPDVAHWERIDIEELESGFAGRTDVAIVDGLVPTSLPEVPAIFIAPPEPLGEGRERLIPVGRLESPPLRLLDPAHPLLAGSEFDEVSILRAEAYELGEAWTPLVEAEIDGRRWPLLATGRIEGRQALLMAFALSDSDLPLRPALPLLLSAALQQLTRADTESIPERLPPGEPLVVSLPADATAMRVTDPEGRTHSVEASEGRFVFAETHFPGIYQVEIEGGPGPRQAELMVSLAEGGAYDIRPRALPADLGSSAPDETSSAVNQGRWPLWRPLAMLALILLLVEWAWDHRAALSRGRRELEHRARRMT